MTQTDSGQQRAKPGAVRSTSGGDRQRGFFAGASEARPGLITSEFWLTLLALVVMVIVTYADDGMPERVGWALFAGMVGAYVISRGIAKAGSREGPWVGRLGDGRDG